MGFLETFPCLLVMSMICEWTRRESNADLFGASEVLYHWTTGPYVITDTSRTCTSI